MRGRSRWKWEKFLHVHKLARPATYQRRLEVFARAQQFAGSAAAIRAKSKLAVARARQLQLLETQIAEYRQEIRRLFAQHPDAKLFGSLPGAGEKIAPRLLPEIGDLHARNQLKLGSWVLLFNARPIMVNLNS